MPFTASIDLRMSHRPPLRFRLDEPAPVRERDALAEADILHRMSRGKRRR